MLTKEQILENLTTDVSYKAWSGKMYSHELEEHLHHESTPVELLGHTFVQKERHGGHEGSGEEHWIVFSVNKCDEEFTYWYVPGYYYSHDGSYLQWEDMYQVKPAQVQVTQWEKLKE
jgi:hypothetical protein